MASILTFSVLGISSLPAVAGKLASSHDSGGISRNLNTEKGMPEGTIQCGVDEDGNPIYVSIDVGCDPNSTNPIMSYLAGIVNFLAAGVVVVVTIMIVIGGIQYMTSRGIPQQVEAAKTKIVNALTALIVFIFMYAFLQWLIPGGLFNGGGSETTQNVCRGEDGCREVQ